MLLGEFCFQLLNQVQVFVTLWTVAHQASLSVGILQARILEWVEISFSRASSRPGIKPGSPVLADSLPLSHLGSPIGREGSIILWEAESLC